MVEVFREVRRVLRDDGTLWLNLGDSYSVGPRFVKNKGSDYGCHEDRAPGLPAKSIMGIPWRVAFALQADGWILRQDIIWAKPNPMPESVTDRCTKSHEYIFLFSKKKKYYYDCEAIKEPCANSTKARRGRADLRTKPRRDEAHFGNPPKGIDKTVYSDMRNKRDVWTVASKASKGTHFATFPPKLIEPCVLAGCPKGGIVLDPFMGSGTTGVVAKQHGRDFLGIELNPEYVALSKQRIEASS